MPFKADFTLVSILCSYFDVKGLIHLLVARRTFPILDENAENTSEYIARGPSIMAADSSTSRLSNSESAN